MPPAAKHPSVRARRNTTSTRALLKPVANPIIPPLPDHVDWHVAVVDWWRACWSSPMAPEWTEADCHALFVAARMMQTVWGEQSSPGQRTMAAAETRHLLRECGLTPMSRRSLQWEIDRGEQADERTRERRNTVKPKAVPDPRVEYPTG